MKTVSITQLERMIKGYALTEVDGNILDLQGGENWTAPTEKQYNKITGQLDKISAKGKGYEIYVWYDVSGFDYWVNTMQEENYAQITIRFDSETFNPKRIPALINKLDRVVNKVEDVIYQFN